MKDYLLTPEGDLAIENGDFVIGESQTQEVGGVLQMNQGELKEDPILGATLIKLMKANAPKRKIQQIARLHLERDHKNYEEIKDKINIKTDGST